MSWACSTLLQHIAVYDTRMRTSHLALLHLCTASFLGSFDEVLVAYGSAYFANDLVRYDLESV